jgi:hypothetical protein
MKNPDSGVVAIPIKASNTSRLDFIRYYRIYPHTNPDIEIVIKPNEGEYFVFSSEIPAGKYNFNRIKIILRTDIAVSTKHFSYQALKGGIPVEVKPSSLTIAGERFFIKQTAVEVSEGAQWSNTATTDWRFETIPDNEMKSLIEEVKQIGGVDQWKIANEL